MKIGYDSIKLWLRIGLFFYFAKIRVLGRKHIPKGKPIMLLANHQNALMDALMIAINSGLKPHFLARSDLFKNGFVSRFLSYIQMMPIYRIRDGIGTLKNNPEIFDKCGSLLIQGETVMLFPEGDHGIQRRVRKPMRSGFVKMILKALEEQPDLDIRILPVGLNYKKAENFPDKVSMIIGKDLSVQEFYDPNDLEGTAANLKEAAYRSLVKLTTHIPEKPTYENIISQLEQKSVNYLDPITINELIVNLDPNEKVGAKLQKKSFYQILFQSIFQLINFPILLIWNMGVKPLGKEIEFRTTLRFVTSLMLFPIFYMVTFIVLLYTVGQVFALTFFLAHVLFNLGYVKFG